MASAKIAHRWVPITFELGLTQAGGMPHQLHVVHCYYLIDISASSRHPGLLAIVQIMIAAGACWAVCRNWATVAGPPINHTPTHSDEPMPN